MIHYTLYKSMRVRDVEKSSKETSKDMHTNGENIEQVGE